ncbi:MAG: hypothetical protein JWM30_3244 [Burkholderia sp.]|nr:hypothetical protein [Burkholderia sp.]
MSQPQVLPSGVWQSLFQSALSVVDEIRKHGGRTDPFFTFGGGTVLMLRHQHRLSKDIDLFVPDPQSLAYVTPRLSDVAETLCHSQYVEAALYVKLQLEAGEIDFVAAPNLLPEEHAFERWDLFGKSVRVETAAEIVAKKIFHRGDKATARDLFDLALVIDRESEAMALAQPFFFRHADKFVEHLQAPSDRFVRQFRDIHALEYRPTFEHAANQALTYFEAMQVALEMSRQDAFEFAKRNDTIPEAANIDRGDYIGKVWTETSHHIVQHVGQNRATIHEKHRLPLHQAGKNAPLHFRYRNGSAQSISSPHRRELGR